MQRRNQTLTLVTGQQLVSPHDKESLWIVASKSADALLVRILCLVVSIGRISLNLIGMVCSLL